MNILYVIKENPNKSLGHAAQRSRAFLKSWDKMKVNVTFVCPGDEYKEIQYLNTKGISFNRKISFISKIRRFFYLSPFRFLRETFPNEILEKLKKNNFDIVVAEELACTRLAFNTARTLGIPCAYIAHNFEYRLFRQIYPFPQRILSKFLLRRHEKKIMKEFDAVFAFSELDRDRIRACYNLHNIKATRAGADIDEYKQLYFNEYSNEIAYVGALDYYPNVEGLRWFSQRIYRKLKTKAKVIVIGKNPVPEVKSLCRKHGFKLIESPSDIKPYLSKARIEIVPLRIGSGTRGKILEAAASRIPVISTTLGAEGLQFKNGRDILLADTSEEFAKQIDLLLESSDLCRTLTSNAYETVKKYDYDRVVSDLTDELRKLLHLRVSKTGS